MKTSAQKFQKGFTLIELLVVIGILAILLAITLVAINPQQQFIKARDTQRKANVSAILNAINQYMIDNNGIVPSQVTSSPANISNTGADLCALLIPKYIAQLPVDPTLSANPISTCSAAYDTGYQVSTSASNRITVSASGAEGGTPISATR